MSSNLGNRTFNNTPNVVPNKIDGLNKAAT